MATISYPWCNAELVTAFLSIEHGDRVLKFLSQGQQHLIEGWDPKNVDGIHQFVDQVVSLDAGYPGGIKGYVSKAQELLKASARGDNPFAGMTPKVPEGTTLPYGSEAFTKMEEIGLDHASTLGFVLVAGGLGERLGYNGIKVALPTETTTGKMYLQLYIESILAIQKAASERTGQDVTLPFAIMTSGDTNEKTVALLEANNYFGMKKDQIDIMKQEKVASMIDNDARLSRDEKDIYSISTKPHGHGDVHLLMHTTGTAKKWLDNGFKWVLFFQDTNAMIFRTVLAAVGVSCTEKFITNSMTGPRLPKRAMGGIVRLEKADGTSITNNVEYNQLDPLLRANGFPEGDVAGDNGFSPFPGNMNQLLFNLPGYVDALQGTQGVVPEFVNPKYADESKQKFKKPTRLECMMQDLPLLFKPNTPVGFTTISGNGLTQEQIKSLYESGAYDKQSESALLENICFYSPVKNNLVDAAHIQRKGMIAGCASVGESDVYASHCKVLLSLGVHVYPPIAKTIGKGDTAININDWPHIVIAPNLCLTTKKIKEIFPTPEKVHIRSGSTLVLQGEGKIVIDSLNLEGALIVKSNNSESTVRIQHLDVNNKGMSFVELSDTDVVEEYLQIRGYRMMETGADDVEVIDHNDKCDLVVG